MLTFGAIHGGAARNVIPEEVRLAGTARTHSVAARDTLERRLKEIAAGVAATTGTRIELTFRHGPDAIINDPAVTAICEQAVARAARAGRDRAHHRAEPRRRGLLGIPRESARLLLPSRHATLGKTPPLLHSGRFDLDDDVLVLGAKLIARSVIALAAAPARA